MKFKQKIKAIKLRKTGKSYSEIQKQINVSKGTLSVWLRYIQLTSRQEKRIYVELKQKNAYRMAKANQKKRIESTKEIVKKAKEESVKLFKNPLFSPGLMLYWAEGAKTNEVVRFSNSDPVMIKFMMRWFREICQVPEEKFKIALHIHSLHCRENILDFWSKITHIPLSQFYKTQIKPTSLGQRRNKLYNGTCSVTVYNKNLFRKMNGWKLGFLEKINKI